MIRKNNDERRASPAPDGLRRADPSLSAEREGNRIARVMARAGLCSRREAEGWIAAGRVAINGKTISSPAVNVAARDQITVDGKPLPRRERTRLFLYHKPVGLVSTNTDPQGRLTIFDVLPKDLPRLMSIGRLDIGTEGLLLLTNDGGLARVLELPDTGWIRRYRVRAHGRISQGDLVRLRDGITIDGVHYGPIDATLEREQGTNVWLSFAIREGKNREVRNVLAHLDLQVNRLIRVEFGPFGLAALAEGAIAEVEIKELRERLGTRIIAQAGCDFSGAVATREAEPAPSREERRELRRLIRGRDRPHERRRGELAPAPHGRDDRGPSGRGERDERPETPPGRPRRGHAWRKDDAPLRRTYRGSRRDDLKIADEDRPDKRAGVMTDRKGRRILVERFGTKKERPQRAETPARGRRRPPPDRASGPRPSRPRLSDERSVETGSARPRKFSSRTQLHREGGREKSDRHPRGARPSRPRPSGPPPRVR